MRGCSLLLHISFPKGSAVSASASVASHHAQAFDHLPLMSPCRLSPAPSNQHKQVAMDMVVASAETGGALAGAMFWNAAHNDTVDWDGYNVQIDR